MPDTTKNVLAVLKSASAFLEAKSIPESRRVCDLLMARLLKCRPIELCFKFNVELDERILSAMRRGVQRLAANEPIQYILGEWDFMGHSFKVDRRALIPRPETERLVLHMLECEPLWEKDMPLIVDMGTGSGVIAICLALARPHARYLALDTSRDALELASENATGLNVIDRVAFSDKELSELIEPGTVSALVGNLPYISTQEYENLPPLIKDYEPRMALDGGPNGLAVIVPVIEDAAAVLTNNGFIFLEIDCRQAKAVSDMMQQAGFSEIVVEKDLAGLDRIVAGRMNGD